MRGHIFKRYENSYTIVLSLGTDPATGKRKQQWIGVKGTRKEAEKRLSELLHQLDTGVFFKPGKTKLAEYLEIWLRDYVRPNVSPRTAEGYESIVRQHLIPKLGNITLTQLKPEHIQRYYSELLSSGRCNGKGGLSARSVRYNHVTLHKALDNAVKWGLIARNPTGSVDLPQEKRKEIHIMNELEMNRFLGAAKSTPYYALFYVALFTGMRRSELLALRWSDVDMLLCQLYVSRSVQRLLDGSLVYREPKTSRGRRMIALSPSTIAVLGEHRTKQENLMVQLGMQLKEDDLVFTRIDGSPVLPDTISHAWESLAIQTNLKGVRLHDARHSHASLMLKQGIHPKIVQERLGHASIQITLDLYSHVVPGLQEAAALRFDEALASVRKNEVIENVR